MNKQILMSMLEYAGIAYSNDQAFKNNEKVITIDNRKTGVQCFIRKNETIVKIIFRGSDSDKDKLTDIMFWKKTIPYNNMNSKIKVHTGFINSYKDINIRNKIHQYITQEIKKIYVTGHSYGAALAVLCALDLQYNFSVKDLEVYLFGCPRVGNLAFKKSYNKRVFKTIRVENGNDIVTKLPPAFMGFRHVGIKLHVGFPRLFGVISFNSHRPREYYRKIWNT